MNKVIHTNRTPFGRTTTIILADGYAYVMVSIMDDNPIVAVIHDLTVHKERRGEGLGRMLLEEATQEAGKIGVTVARLAVKPNSWLAEWYKRHGFVEIGPAELPPDHIVMEKDLNGE